MRGGTNALTFSAPHNNTFWIAADGRWRCGHAELLKEWGGHSSQVNLHTFFSGGFRCVIRSLEDGVFSLEGMENCNELKSGTLLMTEHIQKVFYPLLMNVLG